MKLALATYFTKSWTYSIDSWADHVQAAIANRPGYLIVSTDNSRECLEKVGVISSRMTNLEIIHISSDVGDDNQVAYKEEAQKIIATIQGKAFSRARDLGVDLLWSIESDVLVPPNALRVLQQAIEFDDGYYDVAMVTYPNGLFLGGFGTTQNHICPDVYDDERVIPKTLQKRIKIARKERLSGRAPTEAMLREWTEVDEAIKACPPKGNVFHLQSKKWRKRGWMDSAYPGIGRGSIVPTDWVGLGCTIMSKKALSLATFAGYELKGTQDLFLCWEKWKPNNIRMCVIPHILCSHVKRKISGEKKSEEIVVYFARHETGGEFDGHPRWREAKWLY